MNYVTTDYNGTTYRVPATGRDEDRAIYDVVPDDGHAMAFLLQDGNLGVPGGRYGSDTVTCAPIALAVARIMAEETGEPMTYYGLSSDMGLVVNSSDGVAELIREHGDDAARELIGEATAEHRKAFTLAEKCLREAIAYAEAYGGPVVDGQAYSPSDRAVPHVERVYQSATDEQWEAFDWALQDLYDALELVWEDGILWRAEDLPADDGR